MEHMNVNKRIGDIIGKKVMFFAIEEDVDGALNAIIKVHDDEDQFGKTIIMDYKELEKLIKEKK